MREYLLSATHPVGRFKAAFFGTLGYDADRWEELRDALLAMAQAGDASPAKPSPYGVKYEVRATLTGPNGRSADLVTVWIVLASENHPRFVTAFPE